MPSVGEYAQASADGTRVTDTSQWWSWQLAQNVVNIAAGRPHVRVLSLALPSQEEFEVTFLPVGGAELVGIRLERGALLAKGSRLASSTVEEVAFDVVLLGLLEPRPDLSPSSGSEGVRWLHLEEWAE